MARFEDFSFNFSRISLFLIYFWFGILKVFNQSPANPLVDSLLSKTLPFFEFNQFIIYFGLLEMLIGILFLFPKLLKLTLVILGFHMLSTFLPLILLPKMTWQGLFIPTLEGQYIIKNLSILSLVLVILTRVKKEG